MRERSRRSIRKQMMILVTLSSIIPLLLLGLFTLVFVNTSAKTNIEERLNDVLTTLDSSLETLIESQKADLRKFGNDSDIQKSIENNEIDASGHDNIMRSIFQYLGRNESLINMYFVLPSGETIGTNVLPDKYAFPEYENWGIYRSVKTAKSTVMYPNPYYYSYTFRNVYSIIAPVTRGGNTGYLIMDVSSNFIKENVQSLKATTYGTVQLIIASNLDIVLYNDSHYNSSLEFVGNVLSSESQNGQRQEDSFLRHHENKSLGLKYYGMLSNEMMKQQNQLISIVLGFLFVLTTIVSAIIGYRISLNIVNPIAGLSLKMESYRPGNGKLQTVKKENEIEELALQFENLQDRVEEYHQKDLEKQELLKHTEIKALMSQINPHFINNTLDSIKWKAKLGEVADIETMVTELAVLLKGSMNTDTEVVTVGEEFEFLESYICIQKFRYGERLNYSIEVQEDMLDFEIPKLILQPLIENAIVHGLEPLDSDGLILINAWFDDEYLYFSVADNGVGTDKTFNEILNGDPDHIGLMNVNKRIQLYYGDMYSLYFDSRVNVGTAVFFTVPRDIVNREEGTKDV